MGCISCIPADVAGAPTVMLCWLQGGPKAWKVNVVKACFSEMLRFLAGGHLGLTAIWDLVPR